jgi:hypothetical protein
MVRGPHHSAEGRSYRTYRRRSACGSAKLSPHSDPTQKPKLIRKHRDPRRHQGDGLVGGSSGWAQPRCRCWSAALLVLAFAIAAWKFNQRYTAEAPAAA